MQRTQQDVTGLIKSQQRRKRWQQIVSTLVCIVVFCTTYALILPAITMSAEVTCGLEEHTHTNECYEQIASQVLTCDPGHSHSDSCYEDDVLVCGISTVLIHTHNEYCVDEDGVLICGLEECAQHSHSILCLDSEGELVCGLEEIEVHTHSTECFDLEGNCVCDLPVVYEHTHSEECCETEYSCGELSCQLEEHNHIESCYENFPEELAISLSLMSASEDVVTVGVDTQDILVVSDPKVEIAYDDVVYDGDTETYSVQFDIAWTLSEENLSEYSAYHIKLPKHMSIPEDLLNTWGTATDSTKGGIVAFYYRFELIDGVYYIHVEYDDEYISKIDSTCDSFIKFHGTLSKDVFQDDGSLKLEWSDGTTTTIPSTEVEYPDNETVNYDIATDKTAVYDSKTGTLTYTVLVSSVKGTPSPLTVTDTVNLGNLPLVSTTPTVTVVDEAGNTVSYKSEASGSTTTYTFETGLGENEYYKITYIYEVGSITPGYIYYPNNTVVAQSTDATTGETVKAQDSTWTKVTKEMLQKSGVYDADNDVIRWTITVNPDGDDITGYVLTDDMMVQGVANGLQISPAEGYTYEIDDGKYKITFVEFDKDGDGQTDRNTGTYTVTYTTKRDQTTVNTQITNTAVLTKPDGDTVGGTGGNSSVWVPADGGISKTHNSLDTATGTLNWTVSLDLPEGGIGAGTVISDNSGYSWAVNTNHWLTQQQITELADTIAALFPDADYTLQFGTNEWDLKEYSDALADLTVTKYYYWRLTFNEDYDPSTDTVNITYSTTFDPNAVTTSATYVNSVSMSGKNAWASVDYKVPVTKMDTNWNTGESTTTTTNGTIGWYIRITPEAGKASISITDILPDGLTLSKLGLGTDGNSARAGYGYSTETSGTLTTWSGIQGAYTVDGNHISVTVTPTSADTIPTGNDIYLYVEAKINDAPDAGSSKTYQFKNSATVDGVTVSQTQNVTWNRPLPVIKTDRNGNTGDTTFVHSDGTVGWYVKIYLESATTDTITITDTLPDGLTLTKIGTGKSQWYASSYSVSDVSEGTTSGVIANTSSASTYTIAGQTVTVQITTDYAAGDYVYVYLECTYDEDSIPDDGLELNNTASVSVGDIPLGTASQKQTVTKPPEDTTGIVDKTGSWSSDTRQLTYNVLINQGAQDLSAGSDILNVKDVMTYDYNPWWYTINSVLISSSVKLYYATENENGGYTLGEEVNPADWTWKFYNNFADIKNSGGKMLNTIELTVPDEKFLILTYIYEFNVQTDYDGTSFNISNSVTVEGDSTTSDSVSNSNDWEVSDVTAGATSTGTYTITKVHTDNYNIVLSGAVFTVYTYADGHPLADSDGNVVTYTSDSAGKVYISYKDGVFEEDVVYYIVETQAPAGYDLPETPRIIYFYFSGDKAGSYTVPDGATNLSTNYGVAYIENAPEAEEAITISKVWLDKDGAAMTPTAESISFHLIQTDYKGNSVHYFKNSLPNGIQIYSNRSVVWVAPFSGALTLSAGEETLNVAVYDLQAAAALSPNEDGTYNLESGKPYQIVVSDDGITSISWSLASTDDSDSGTFDLTNGSWTTSIVVPKSDQEGNAYNYSASELDVEGFVSESVTDADGNITITNREEESAELTVKKEWHDVAEADRKPVSIQLYQSVDTLFTEYTAFLGFISESSNIVIGSNSTVKFTTNITGAGVYTIRWDMSNYGFTDVTDFEAFFIDIADPNFALQGYKITNLSIKTDQGSYSVNDKFVYEIHQYTGGYDRINFYNKYDDALYMDALPQISADGYLEVSFTLEEPEGSTGVLPELYAYLPSANAGGTAYGDPITLSSENSWTGSWSDLPLKGTDSDGNIVYYSYYVVETTTGYDVSYSNEFAVDGGTITVNNYPKSTADLTVNKSWKDDNDNDIVPPIDQIEYELLELERYAVKIYRGGWGWANEEVIYVLPGTEITLTFIGNEIVQSSNYTVVSRKYVGSLYFATTDCYTDLYEYTCTRTITDSFTTIGMSYGGYPLAYKEDYSWDGAGAYDIGTYTKYVVQSDGSHKEDGTITLGDYTWVENTDNAVSKYVSLGTFKLNASNSWENLHANLVPNTYQIRELTTGYTTTYELTGEKEGTETTMSGGGVQFELEAGAEAEMEITNKLSVTSIEVGKQWRDNGESESVLSVDFTLYQQVTIDGVTTTVPYRTYTMTDEGWSTANFTVNDDVKQRFSSGTLSSVDIAKKLGGSIQFTLSEAGTITVVACSTSDDKTSHIALMDASGNLVENINGETDILVSGSGGTTLTWNVPAGTYKIVSPGCTHYNYYNSLEHDRAVCVKSITVVEGTGNPAYTYSFNVVEDVTATSHGASVTESSYTVPRTLLISDLPRADADGNYYTYYVVEEEVTGYKAHYSANGGSETTKAEDASLTVEGDTGQKLGTYTITNEAVTEIGLRKSWASGVTPTAVQLQLWRVSSTGGANLLDLSAYMDASGNVDLEKLKDVATWQRTVYINCNIDNCGHDDCTSSKSKTFRNLPLYDYNEDGTVSEYYTYFIVEVANGYVKSYKDADGNVIAEPTFVTGGQLYLENNIVTTEITANKEWTNGASDPVDVTLYQQPVYYHTHTYTTTVTDPTCSAQGYTTYTCTSCGFSYKSDYTETTEHSYRDWVTVTPATCAAEGMQKGVCSVCSASGTRTIAKTTDHTWGSGVETDGVVTYTCTVCQATKTETAPAACSHTNTTTTTVDATCTTDGSTTVICDSCHTTVSTETIPALGHSYDSVVTAPTCTAQGYTTHTCSRCNDTYIDTNTDANGHTYVNGVCSVCGATESTGGAIELLTEEVVTGNWENRARVDITSLSFSSGGYFTIEYTVTGSGSYFCVEFETAYEYDNDDFLTSTSQDQGKYTVTLDYTTISDHWFYASRLDKLTILEIAGVNITVTSITWTPAATTSPSALMLMSVNSDAIMLTADEENTVSVGAGVAYGSFVQVTPGTPYTWTDLPRYILDDEGNIIGEYLYYVKETGEEEFEATYKYTDTSGNEPEYAAGEDQTGIAGGSVTITNTQVYSYELPESGSVGTRGYTITGVALMLGAAVVLMYSKKKGRREARTP